MDLKRIERFLSAMMPSVFDAKDSVNIAFECMKAHPMTAVPTITNMIGRLQGALYSMDKREQQIASSAVLTGVMIAWATEDQFLRECIIDHYLEQSAKLRGENVVDFFDKKAGR
jgi:hypothetical protein